MTMFGPSDDDDCGDHIVGPNRADANNACRQAYAVVPARLRAATMRPTLRRTTHPNCDRRTDRPTTVTTRRPTIRSPQAAAATTPGHQATTLGMVFVSRHGTRRL